jgi:hypothetical protein
VIDYLTFDWLWTLIKDLVDWIVSGFNSILDLLLSFLDWILRLVIYLSSKSGVLLWNQFVDMFNFINTYLIIPMYDYMRGLPSVMASGFGVEIGGYVPVLVDFLHSANYFFPVIESAALLGAVVTYWMAVMILKITLKLIPTIY